jgi:ABC transporter substrate binding protein
MVGSVAAWPAWAQQAAHQHHRIVLVSFGIPAPLIAEKGNNPAWRAMYLELRRLGHIEGENLIVDRFSAEGHAEHLVDMAREVVKRRPDVILSEANGIARALAAATTTIPIVSWMGDPITFRLVTSLARPDGNITGIAVDAGWELVGKQLEILKEAVPSATKIAYLDLRANMMSDRPDINFKHDAERRLN